MTDYSTNIQPPGEQFSGHSQLFVDAQQVARLPLGHIIIPQSIQLGLVSFEIKTIINENSNKYNFVLYYENIHRATAILHTLFNLLMTP